MIWTCEKEGTSVVKAGKREILKVHKIKEGGDIYGKFKGTNPSYSGA